MIEMHTFIPKENIDFKNLFAKKIGYSKDVFYFGETKEDKSLYYVANTTAIVNEYSILIIGELRDIEKSRALLEDKLKMKLTESILKN